ncbi:MAG: glycoside hydrolase family 15 protein [Planctomycetes bacterium]|nr:glycoside hydrolase family 15 protein [Planctomycetota bacterium]
MSLRIEEYAMIGDCQTAALISRGGSIDWLCLPRFDSGACFAALLGTSDHGRWLLAPASRVVQSRRRYREGTLVLETDYETDGGAVTVIDCMPPRTRQPDLVRQVVGLRGQVPMRTEIIVRFDYGSLVPWVRRMDGGIVAIAGPDVVQIRSDVELRGEDFKTVADFTITAGESRSFVLTWHPSHLPAPRAIDPDQSVRATVDWWAQWSRRCTYQGDWREAVVRSLITLKALTYAPTGGIVAAATTSLPEKIGGVRNWDYRFCWLRDATFTLYSLLISGYHHEARAWRQWLLRAVAGRASQLQILYGVGGERRLNEFDLDWLPGYENSAPVRIGNAAHSQFQLDVFGEVMDALNLARRSGLEPSTDSWHVERELLSFLETHWTQQDEGIWEVRGPRQHFTHSKVMAWVAFDRAVKDAERLGLDGPVSDWRKLRDTIHAEVCSQGFDARLGSFVQSYGSRELDASLLMMAAVGFLPATDERVLGTVAAIERHLMVDGFVMRYGSVADIDGLPPGEGAFLPCTFWLADNYALQGRHAEARSLFERLLQVRNDVGLLSEEYDPAAQRLLGNFPQAFSHVGLVNSAHNLSQSGGPAEHRQQS